MNSEIITYLGIESLTIRQIIDSVYRSGKFPNVSEGELNLMLLDRRPIELLLLMKECA